MTLLTANLQVAFLVAVFLACCLGTGVPLARRLGLPGVFVFPLGFAVVSLAGYVVFFAWWWHPPLGSAASVIAGLGGIALFAAEIASKDSELRRGRRSEWTPVLLFVLLGTCYALLLRAGDRPAATRFNHGLPIDDQLPRFFAEKIAAGQSPTPLAGDWLSSDRPPLQTGITLLFRPFGLAQGRDAEAYQVVATMCQLMWLPALIALAHAVRLRRRAIAAGLFAAASSGFFAVNSLYVWPKLCAAALVITALSVIVESCRAPPASSRLLRSAAVGTIAALATMAHGGVWFSLLAIPALPAAWTVLKQYRVAGVVAAAACFAVVASPWSAYKAFFDPPGNRLVKWHLAGVIPIDERGAWQTIRESYASKPASEHFERWRLNLLISFTMPENTQGEPLAAYVRRAQFFNFAPSVGLPLLGAVWLLGLALLRPGAGLRPAGGLVLFSIATVVVWTALMFMPLSSVVHQGSYVPVALLIFFGAAAFAHLPGSVGLPLLALHAGIFAWAWVATTPQNADGSAAQSNLWVLAGAAVVFAAFTACLRALERDNAG